MSRRQATQYRTLTHSVPRLWSKLSTCQMAISWMHPNFPGMIRGRDYQLKESKLGYLGLLELAPQDKSERICAILVLSISVERSWGLVGGRS